MTGLSLPRAGETVRDAVVRNMILYKVQREITCPVTGEVLDVRTCVAVVGGPQNDHVLAVMSPEGWKQKETEVRRVAKPNITVWVGSVEQAQGEGVGDTEDKR